MSITVNDTVYAHSLAGRPVDEWQTLESHLRQTAELAESFTKAFAPGWGRIAGLWHDAGKYARDFQRRIGANGEQPVNERVDHSSAGALIASRCGASMLAFAIAGHHGGLVNQNDLGARLKAKRRRLEDARAGGLPSSLEEEPVPLPPNWLAAKTEIALWTRFLFSALVDADFLDTERFYAGAKKRAQEWPAILELGLRLREYLDRKTESADATPVNEMRARVLAACRAEARSAPGAFTLTVPTGGGKTLASLAFALEHAARHDLQRVIVVIPYTSIIEQTAAEYRRALGDDVVVEHHTNVDPDTEDPMHKLASENWDAPIIVTTSVQFFESLFANRPSRCRKLHNMARAAIILDEVQTLPAKLLDAVRYALKELTSHYASTLVLCTATQPALIAGAKEIMPDPSREFAVVANRCEVLWPQSDTPTEWDALAEELRGHEQVLAIVHRRDDAQRLAELVEEDCYHLSARMCAQHRSHKLSEIKRRLKDGRRCRVVATQLVEAGVDLDFPEVYRAFAGLDSLAQAAGRCNREGRGQGRLHVFVAPTEPPRGILRTARDVAKSMSACNNLDLTSPATFSEYFRRLYRYSNTDVRAIMAFENEFEFEESARQFRMIEEAGEPVVAPYGDWQHRVEEVRAYGVTRDRMRRLQQYMVNLYPQEVRALDAAGALERIQDTFWAVVPGFRVYSARWGFGWQAPIAAEPESLIA